MKKICKIINGKLNTSKEVNLEVVASILSREDKLLRTKIESEILFNLSFPKGQVKFLFTHGKWLVIGTEKLSGIVGVDIRNDLAIYMGAKVQLI